MTTRIDSRKIARRISQVAKDVAAAAVSECVPDLATVLVGDDPASAVYVAAKHRAIRQAGMRGVHRSLPRHATQRQVAAMRDELTADLEVSGILLQLPLPAHLGALALIDRIPDSAAQFIQAESR